MKIGLIIIGDEILSGKTQDCNMLYLGKKLQSLGMDLEVCQVISDQENTIHQTFKYFLENYDLVICSGGLGPTIDDRTKLALGKFLGEPLTENEAAKHLATNHYARRGLEWRPELNNYHLIPKGIKPYENPVGLAPGLYLKTNHSELLCAPGVPKEFKSMVDLFLSNHPKIHQPKEKKFFTIRTSGIPEEKIFNELCPNLWAALEKFGTIASYPRFTGIDIILNNIQISEEELIHKLNQMDAIKPIQNYIWHLGNGHLEELIIEYAKKMNWTLSSAESCTGGLIAHMLTSISGSSDAYWGSVISYDNSAKINLLNVNKSTLQKFGAVSTQVAEEMARGAKEKLKTDFAISTSGIAGPLGGTAEKPVGTVAIAVAHPNGIFSKMYHLPAFFDREELKIRFAHRALICLFKQMKMI